MSLYDVSKLSGASPLRGVGRELSGEKPAVRSERAKDAADQGVSVQTGAKVSAGEPSMSPGIRKRPGGSEASALGSARASFR